MANNVWFAIPKERTISDQAANACEVVAQHAGSRGYTQIILPYCRVDAGRNMIAYKFLAQSKAPDDVLVMLDNDHLHPPDIIERLVENISGPTVAEGAPVGVLGALAFMRGEPFSPCFFVRADDNALHPIVPGNDGIYAGQVVGHAAVAIARWVFDELEAKGFRRPWWRYTYTDDEVVTPSEDMYFGRICEQAGIYHWCDMRLETPHIIASVVNRRVWGLYHEEHALNDPQPVLGQVRIPAAVEA